MILDIVADVRNVSVMADHALDIDPAKALASLDSFSRLATLRPLRGYQIEAGDAILRSVFENQGHTFTVMMARQSGKNELSAQLEAYLLHRFAAEGGQLVKAAPSFRPQITNSIIRLRETLSHPFSAERWLSRHGFSIELGLTRIMFYSADPSANVVGATASILLEIDEAQDVDSDVYWRSFRPMAATARTTTVLYGTAWDEDNILEDQRRHNRRREAMTGLRLNFEAPWQTLAALSPQYEAFVRDEIERLGENHPAIQTQYLLRPIAGASRLFPEPLILKMHGDHERQQAPVSGVRYVAGVDIAGQVVQPFRSGTPLLNRHDETVITLAEVSREGASVSLPIVRVVEHYRWRDLTHVEQYDRILRLFRDTWQPARVSVDATGIGAGLTSFLDSALPGRIDPVMFTSRSKSELGFGMLSAAETGRLRIYRSEGRTMHEFWQQLRRARYQLRASEEINFAVPQAEGHDDFVMSLALCVRAATALTPPAAGTLLRAQPGPDDSGW
ncbi:MAG TPA: hypothetical protein VFB34_10585 [Chloroflexota bacterium]|nr:hypothetical protein [Chloroflexota bacterium]